MSVMPGGRGRLLRIRRLSVAEWRLIGEAWVLAVVVQCALRWTSFHRLTRWLDRPAIAGPRSVPPDVTPHAVARLVRSAAARAGRSTCLTRALVLKRMLRCHGIETELVIGARRVGAGLAAHAWLRLGDEVLLGGEGHDEYAPVWTRSATMAGASP